ncbi:MAG: cytochrome P450 [Aquificaceae bacterium]|nr:MAG: cytochrome P450 [Aquificaceae bacterium]
MSHFKPPYPPRPKKQLNPFQSLLAARKNLLSIWPEFAFKKDFMHFKVLKQHIFVVNSPETIRHVFIENGMNYLDKTTQQVKALEPLLGNGLFVSTGETWKKHRKLLTPSFDNKHVKMYSDVMISAIQDTEKKWDKLDSGTKILMQPEMAQLGADIIARTLFGEKLGSESAAAVVTAFADYQTVVRQMDIPKLFGVEKWIPNLNGKFGTGKKSAKTIHAVIDAIIEKATYKENEETLAAQLVRASETLDENKAMTREEIRNEIIVLFMAGHETTANVLSWMWYLLSQAPEVEKKLHEELARELGGKTPSFEDIERLPYTRAILDETMRLYPPVPVLARMASEDDTINGMHVPAKSNILIVPWLIQRHHKYWDKPDHFIPERFMPDAKKAVKFTYIPFSAGPRVCPGKAFGIKESVLVFAILAQRFRAETTPEFKGEQDCRLTLRPKDNLPMVLIKR